MVFAKAFFDLQLSFAERVQAMSGMPLERALLDYTNLYVRFGLGRDFDPGHATWQAYLAGLSEAEDRRDWTYRFYRRDDAAATAQPLAATFGCFSYGPPNDGRVRLHFKNTDPEGCSPLSVPRIDQRRADLTALFRHLRGNVRGDVRVVGVSWLYNLDAYRRLFPRAYTSSARVVPGGFRSMPLWGQFLDHRGEVKEPMARPFLKAVAEHGDLARASECFPFRVQTTQASARHFYEVYGIGDRGKPPTRQPLFGHVE